MKIRTTALTLALTATLGTGVANADAIDNALAKLPAGPISCEQASRYWTNDADFNAKKNQANTIAMFDRRGPQIQAALGRVEEAVNRCGLRGTTGTTGTTGNTGNTATPAQPAKPAAPAPAPAPTNDPAPAPATPVITLAPANVPTVDVPVANAITLRLPDLAAIVQELLSKQGSSLPF